METQTSLAIPDEDDGMSIYSACQGVDLVQQVVTTCLNLQRNKVRVITRRLGGGFGGKALRNQQMSAAVALAAYKLKVPVRISLDRNTDMQMVGGRFPTHTTFTVAFTKAGKITALSLRILVEAGWFPDVATLLPALASFALKKYDWAVEYTLCRTNNVPKTAVRAPGHCEASAIVDAIMNRIATSLGIIGNHLRDVNMHTPESFKLLLGPETVDAGTFSLPAVWERAKMVSEVEEWERAIMRWNKGSRWVKRGVAMVPSLHHVMQIPTVATVSLFMDGSVAVEVGGVEMGQGLYTKFRQVVVFALSPLWNQVEGAFVMGIGFYLIEDIERDNEGRLLSDGTTIDTIPQQLNVELFNSPAHKDRIFSSKAMGEPPLLLAGSVYAAMHHAIAAARRDYLDNSNLDPFQFDPPATIDKVKGLCGLDNVERYLNSQLQTSTAPHGKLL